MEYQRPIEGRLRVRSSSRPADALPLQLTTGHARGRDHEQREEAFFEISADDAAAGPAEGDLSRLVLRRGALEAKAQISDRVFPGLVWMALHFAEQKVNWLTRDVGDPLMGTPDQGQRGARRAGQVMSRAGSSRRSRGAATARRLRRAVPVRAEVRVDAAAPHRLGLSEGAVAATDHQTGGRGRLGRARGKRPGLRPRLGAAAPARGAPPARALPRRRARSRRDGRAATESRRRSSGRTTRR